jgi:hypothetical protein
MKALHLGLAVLFLAPAAFAKDPPLPASDAKEEGAEPTDARRERIRKEVAKAREHALKRAQEEREQALAERKRIRAEALKEAEHERAAALDDAESERATREAEHERAQALREAHRARSEALREAEHERAAAMKEADRAREHARKAIERARRRARVISEQHAFADPELEPIVVVEPRRRDRPPAEPSEPIDEGRSRGGVLVAAGAADGFGMVPLRSDLMAGARLQIAMALPSDSVRWLSHAVLGLSGGVDAGNSRGVDAQMYRGGLVLAIGAPWSRDVLGIGIEGGLLAGRYYDSNPVAYKQSTKSSVTGPYGESMDARLYGIGRLTVQVPLKGDVRPFLAGEGGMAERPDGRPSALAGITAGVAWNAW